MKIFSQIIYIVINENVSNKNIFAHVYSNNGTWVWGSLLQRNDIPKFEKVIFDSAAYLLYERGIFINIFSCLISIN